MNSAIQRICQWIVERAGLDMKVNAAMASQYLVSNEHQADRPDLEQMQREHDAEIVARDEALTEMRAAIEDLDKRLRRSDPIVQQALSQDNKSVTFEMCRAMFVRLENLDKQVKRLDTPRETQPAQIEERQADMPEARKA